MKEEVIVVASQNAHKIAEIEAITSRIGLKAIGRDEAGVPPFEVEETGATFEGNSYIKAKAIMDACGLPTIADDSGLMVDCLDGAPGVYSARFSGDDATDASNNAKLLLLMEDVPEEKRGAKFVSVITLLYPDGRKIVARGECPGRILFAEQGTGGFGYDPLFLPDGQSETFAELAGDAKNAISHRGRALAELRKKLEQDV